MSHRQTILRPSQGGKMRGPVGGINVDDGLAMLEGIENAHGGDEADRFVGRVVADRSCACGYLVCAKTGPCAPPPETGAGFRIEVGMRVRVREDAISRTAGAGPGSHPAAGRKAVVIEDAEWHEAFKDGWRNICDDRDGSWVVRPEDLEVIE